MNTESSLLSFHIRGMVAKRHKKRCVTICLRMLYVAIISVKRGEQHEYRQTREKGIKHIKKQVGYTNN